MHERLADSRGRDYDGSERRLLSAVERGGTMHQSADGLHKTPRPQLRVEHAGPYEAPQGKDYPPHRHQTWEILYYRAGSIDSVVGGEVHPGQPAVLLAVPPRVVHSERARTAYANFWIQLHASDAQPWPRVCYDDEHATLGRVCGALVREWRGRAPGREELIGLLLDELDVLLRRADEQAQLPERERLVQEAERLLEERSGSPVRIGEIAREVGVSPSFLRAQFVRLRGRTPMAHLQGVRIQHALALIRNSNVPLEAIAGACGYDSASHLSRHVKQATGKSPGTLRVH